MVTVRYPNGQCLTYNEAHDLTRNATEWDLYTKKDGKWVASIQISAGVIVEVIPPCKIENPIQQLTVDSALELLIKHIRDAKNFSNVTTLKSLLRKFNSAMWEWKR